MTALPTNMFSNTSKMPCHSISLSAKDCITGGKLAQQEGTVCSGCYALKGMYVMPNVKEAMDRRKRFFASAQFVPQMIAMLKRKRNPHFRWFDSGDVQSVKMAHDILDIVAGTPQMHWIPSKEPKIWREALDTYPNPLPDNFVLRISATKIDGKPSKRFAHTSTVHTEQAQGFACPAYSLPKDHKDHGKCLDCRACWDKSVPNVSYPKH